MKPDISCLRTRTAVGALRAADCRGEMELRVMGSGRRVKIRVPTFTIGSGRRNHLVLRDAYASALHCSILVQEDGLWIQDDGSRNGTWVNGLRVTRCRLLPGARVVVGRTSLQLQGETPQNREHGIVGDHPRTRRVLEQIERLGPSLKPVLILGETGTGKELVARALHLASPCRLSVFEPMNCGAIAHDLAESELFGHAEGAFTGASRERRGAFERADGGTLFLDEVGEMSMALQPKLLRVLEDRGVQRMGEEQRRQVDVRVVAATHRDLPHEVQRGAFRLDLYHRLAVGVIELPPLRERREDIPLLVSHFLRQEAKNAADMPHVGHRVMSFLQGQPWPGNVRELRHAIQRAVMEGEPKLRVEHFDVVRKGYGGERMEDYVCFRGRPFEALREEVFIRVLREHGGNRTAAAAALGIPKSTFFDQLKLMRLEE